MPRREPGGGRGSEREPGPCRRQQRPKWGKGRARSRRGCRPAAGTRARSAGPGCRRPAVQSRSALTSAAGAAGPGEQRGGHGRGRGAEFLFGDLPRERTGSGPRGAGPGRADTPPSPGGRSRPRLPPRSAQSALQRLRGLRGPPSSFLQTLGRWPISPKIQFRGLKCSI